MSKVQSKTPQILGKHFKPSNPKAISGTQTPVFCVVPGRNVAPRHKLLENFLKTWEPNFGRHLG